MYKQTVLVSPNTTDVQNLMADVTNIINTAANKTLNIEYYLDKDKAEDQYRSRKDEILAGIVFSYANSSLLNYAIRLPDGTVPTTQDSTMFTIQSSCRQGKGDAQNNDDGLMYAYNCEVNKYLFSSYVQLQTAIETALIRDKMSLTSFPVPDVFVEMFPKPAFLQDSSYIQIISSMYFVIAYSPFISVLMALIVTEKEKKIKEGMKMMGLRSSVYWCSWAMIYTVIFALITAFVTLIAYVAQFFQNSNMFLFFILQFFYGLSIISMAFMFTPFFKKANTAGGVSSLFTMLSSCLYLIVSLTRTYDEGTGSVSYKVPVYGRWLLCLISPCALSLGMDQAIYLDIRGGMNMESAREGEFPLYAPIIMLLVDTVLYFTLAVYFDNIVPGEYGPRYKPWYIFSKKYWFPEKRKRKDTVSYNNDVFVNMDSPTNGSIENADIEPVLPNMESKAAVFIENLCKKFPNKEKGQKDKPIKAVDNLSLTIYEDQITAILGHNGAGKTTTMNILTGLTGPSSGSAKILGYDCSDPQDIETLRSMTGVCPQHNILFDVLNCTEHLKLFAGIKGVPEDRMEKEIHDALESVDLLDQKDVLCEHLSGGQKRKLSVAISVIGDPKLIFLDEPTAGMDPYSRRHLWSVLKDKKKGRIILLTTHFMDEADILADRKAIINKGHLRCCGSSLFLKNRFGLGYHLNMVVDSNCDPARVDNFVSNIIEGSETNRSHGKELDITLPHNQVNKFADLFSKLEDKTTSESLGVKNFGVSMTTLEEVFLKLEEDVDVDLQEINLEQKSSDKDGLLPKNFNKYGPDADETMASEKNPSDTVVCVEGSKLFWQRFRALALIRLQKFRRSVQSIVMQLILPVILLVIGLVLAKTLNGPTNTPLQQDPRLLNPAVYTKLASGANQYFPYSTIPRFLLRDQVNSTLSQTMTSNIGALYTTNQYDDSYYADKFLLLDKIVSPHYLGVEINTLTQTALGITSSYKVMYNDSAVHSIPTTVNLMSNFLLASAQGSSVPSTLIEAYSLPWPKLERPLEYNSAAFASILLIGMAFAFAPSSFAVDVVKDRQFKIRSQLRVSGLPFFQYWFGFFVTDFAKNLVPAVLTIIISLAVQLDGLTSGGAVLSFIILALFYVPANILFSYFFSFIYDKYETCQSTIPTAFIMLGYVPYIPVSIVDMVTAPDVAKILHYCFCVLIPPYNMFGGLYYINKVYTQALITGTTDSIEFSDYFAFSSNIPIAYLMSLIHVFVFFFLLRVMDISKTGGDLREACMPRKGDNSVIPVTNNDIDEREDEDILAERERVRNLGHAASHTVPVAIADSLRKEFPKDKKKPCTRVKEESVKVAVRNQSFAVDAGEVFGLLGPNGAGKTTTLNMMIADISPNKGKVVVGGHDIHSSLSDAFQAMGYCPQHDALWDDITLQEHLNCYAMCRGIPQDQVDNVTNYFLGNLKLDIHQGKVGKALSGGTKRKLSYCLSMLGRPKIVLLDEPSTGMDPQSKRFLCRTANKMI
ncbi:ATP-binding cassette sub- A member 5 [Mactra antiquata]